MGVFVDFWKIEEIKRDIDNLFISTSKQERMDFFSKLDGELDGYLLALYKTGILKVDEFHFLKDCQLALFNLKIEEFMRW